MEKAWVKAKKNRVMKPGPFRRWFTDEPEETELTYYVLRCIMRGELERVDMTKKSKEVKDDTI